MDGRARATRIALAIVLLAAPLARADLIALLSMQAGSNGLDIVRMNATTGEVLSLPAGVNTVAHELHPSFGPGGNRIVFHRLDLVAQTNQIVVADLRTGEVAELFTIFEASTEPPSTPVFSEDGADILTAHVESGVSNRPALVRTSLTNFPNGPFPHTIESVSFNSSAASISSLQPSVGLGLLAVQVHESDRPDSIDVRTASGVRTIGDRLNLAAPAVPRLGGTIIVFERIDSGRLRLAFRSIADSSSQPTVDFPSIVNKSKTEAHKPAFSPDGRYLAFFRRTAGGLTDRLFVLDTKTQLLLNPDGVANASPNSTVISLLRKTIDGISLFSKPVFTISPSVTATGLTFSVASPTLVGIIVQRIVGRKHFLGRVVPRLKFVGRVPFGEFAPDVTHQVAWDQKVDGKRLRRGRYLVTPRSITPGAEVLDLGDPVEIRIP